MAEIANFQIAPSVSPARQFVTKNGPVHLVMPCAKAITDTVGSPNTFAVVNDAGIPEPDAAPTPSLGGAGVLTGTYAYYATFYDSNTLAEGNPTAISSSVNPSSQQVSIDLTPITNSGDNTRVTHIRLYRNLYQGSTYFYLTQVTVGTSSYADNNSDASIENNDELKLDNNAPVANTYGFCTTHKSYTYLVGPYNQTGGTDYDDKYIVSKAGLPDQYPPLGVAKVEPGRYGILLGAFPIGDMLIFYKNRAIYMLRYDENPSGIFGDGAGKTMNTERGAVNARTIVNVHGTHYVMDREGIYAYTGGTTVVEMALQLRRDWTRINWQERLKFSATWKDDRIWFWVALDNDTECHHAFVLDLKALRTGRGPIWSMEYQDFGVRDACRYFLGNYDASIEYGMDGKTWPSVLTEYGYCFMPGIGYTDGGDPRLALTGTVTGGTSTTVLDSTQSNFKRTNENGDASNVIGLYLRFPNWPTDEDKPTSDDWSQAYRITAVNGAGTEVTVTPAMPAAPPAGVTYEIGAIPNAVFKTPQMSFGSAWSRKAAPKLRIEHQGGGLGFDINYSVSKDRLADIEADAAISETGYSTTSGSVNRTITMGGDPDNDSRIGTQELPLGNRKFHYMQISVDGSGVFKPAVIDSMEIRVTEDGE